MVANNNGVSLWVLSRNVIDAFTVPVWKKTLSLSQYPALRFWTPLMLGKLVLAKLECVEILE